RRFRAADLPGALESGRAVDLSACSKASATPRKSAAPTPGVRTLASLQTEVPPVEASGLAATAERVCNKSKAKKRGKKQGEEERKKARRRKRGGHGGEEERRRARCLELGGARGVRVFGVLKRVT
ncbi:FHA domain-containing protein, partial [Toxoplasma gondii FOU]